MPLIIDPVKFGAKFTGDRKRATSVAVAVMSAIEELKDTSHFTLAIASILIHRGLHGEALEKAFEAADYCPRSLVATETLGGGAEA